MLTRIQCLSVALLLSISSFAQPIITSFTPVSGFAGTSITINGNNFSAVASNNSVFFGGVKASVTAATANSLTVTIPVGAQYWPLSVTVNGLTAFSSGYFTPAFPGGGNFFTPTSFNPQKLLLVQAGNPRDVHAADLNGDGRPDLLVTAPPDSIISILRNTGVADSFYSPLLLKSAGQPQNLFLTDLNGDGKPEIIVTNLNAGQQSSISIFRNSSIGDTISFSKRIDSLTGLGSIGIGAADLNGDGKPDLVVTSGNSGIISLFMNTSVSDTISFAARTDISALSSHSDNILLVDIDNDGKTDIVTADFSAARISVYRNISSGSSISFAPSLSFTVGTNPTSVVAGDFDSDGLLDIAVLNYGSQSISLLRNISTIGAVSFSPKTDISLGGATPGYLSSGDVNGDGKPDLVYVDQTNNAVCVLRNNTQVAGSINFNVKAPYTVGSNANGVTIADINGDSKPELIVANGSSASLSLLRNTVTDPRLFSFTPKNVDPGDTVIINGRNFTGTTAVRFGNITAASFSVVSDSLIRAIPAINGASGFVSVRTPYGVDSAAGFTFGIPRISLRTDSDTLVLKSAPNTYSKIQRYTIFGKYLQGPISISTPPRFEISLRADSAFSPSLSLAANNGTSRDSTTIFVRFKTDSAANFYNTISHNSLNAATQLIRLTGITCDSLLLATPAVNAITMDSTICYKDSIRLATNGSYPLYRWSTGDTSAAIVVRNSAIVSLQVGSKTTCLSNISSSLRLIKNTNSTPIISQVNDSILLSSNAPHYRWSLNDKPVDTTASVNIRKIGFYKVETSNDKICWDASQGYPVVILAATPTSDSLKINLFPNPATGGSFNVGISLQNTTNVVTRVTVTDVSGAAVLQTNKFIFFGREIKIPITLTNKGTFFVKVDINGSVKTSPIILQ